MYKDYQTYWPLLTLIWTVLYHGTEGVTIYCSQDGGVFNISRVTTGLIKTLYDGQTFYDKNLNCDWIVDTGSDPYVRIQIFVVRSDVQWAPEGAICNGYDSTEVRDGEFADSPLLAAWCGETKPQSIISTGNRVYIKFNSNDREIRKRAGITLNFTTFSVAPPTGACPYDWEEGPGSNCYSLKDEKKTWVDAQHSCGIDQANLVSFADRNEAEFIKRYVKENVPDDSKVWLSLNDISVNGRYKWIDDISSSFDIAKSWWLLPHTPDVYLDCVSLRAGDGHLQEEFCTDGEVQTLTKYSFICKRRKVGATAVYSVPESTADKEGQKGTLPPKGLIIAGTIIGFVVMLALIAVAFFVKKKGGCCGEHSPGGASGARGADTERVAPPPTYTEVMKDGVGTHV